MNEKSSNPLLKLVAEMRDLEAEIESREEALKPLKKRLDGLRLYEIPEAMEQMEIKNVSYDGIGRVQLASDVYASTAAGMKDEAMVWLRDCGYANMITEGYNASSLKALFRRMIKEGAPIPDHLFTVTPFQRASIVKS